MMIKQVTLISLLFLLLRGCNTQSTHDNIPAYFSEIEAATKENINLWDKDLYGAMLLVDPQTKNAFANEPDTAGILKPYGSVYSGVLPDDVNIANTAIDWNGKKWAMIMLPLPQNKQKRINLLAHELFHSSQPLLGFSLSNAENNHLDDRFGRIYLRLELEALKKAVQAPSEKELQQHLTNALSFRKYRNLLYPDTDITENLLELNEGIAEFTGLIISGRNKKQATEYFINGINTFFTNPTFVRSFAYFTIPAYGYLLYNIDKNWNKNITAETDLTEYFIQAFNINIPSDLKQTVETISDNYNGKEVIQEETEREERNRIIIAEYKQKFIELPHFELKFEQMSLSFDPRNIMPLEDMGTVYPNIKIIDIWGILTVENGALMSPSWDKITITIPLGTEGKKVTGDGWTLELSESYIVKKEEISGNYKVIKK
ncbi:MAG: hypothetical protein FWF65_06705 [Bacteroidetes bacterium]|nr:hypothetical protein [Bacteroidota bacterium]